MVISVMVVANTLYGQATTMGVSLIVNHTIGLTILSLILLVGRNKPAIRGPGLKAPWYLYFNGLFGLAILNLNYYTVINAGASLAMASTVFGQSICSLVFDLTGWMGMQKRSLNKTKAVSLLVSLAGILAMATSGDGTFALLSILLGILAGALTMTQMVRISSGVWRQAWPSTSFCRVNRPLQVLPPRPAFPSCWSSPVGHSPCLWL
jgi:transporter family-2 protein